MPGFNVPDLFSISKVPFISIKSSINYAKRIQEAMLPKHELQKRLLPDSFILLKPRDSVSGDFYWFTEMKSWYNPDVIFTVADCTGHGVPGAFMSLIGINALNGIINKGIAETDQILSELHQEIRTALQQETTGNNDGMDVALCIYRKEKNTLEFSGAKNSLIYIQDNKLFQVKGEHVVTANLKAFRMGLTASAFGAALIARGVSAPIAARVVARLDFDATPVAEDVVNAWAERLLRSDAEALSKRVLAAGCFLPAIHKGTPAAFCSSTGLFIAISSTAHETSCLPEP